jgi:hypothetical protein
MLKRDSILFGILIGILIPIVAFGLIQLINIGLENIYSRAHTIQLKTAVLISVAVNLVPMRIYFVNLKMDKTGRGLLIVIFVLTLLFFAQAKYQII